jgi:aquaporin Z
MTVARALSDGWHWREWFAEFVGTALLLFLVVTTKYWVVRIGPTTSFTFRVAAVGAVAGLVVAGVALSPLGRRSGAHLNPAVTVGFWVQKVVGRADLAGYCLAQMFGGVAGVAARVWGAHVGDATIHWAVITPESSVSAASAAAIETAATFGQLVRCSVSRSSTRTGCELTSSDAVGPPDRSVALVCWIGFSSRTI